MEGVSGEASSLAGHLGLDNLVFLYDDNHVSIDGDTEIAFTEDRVKRYEAYGWRRPSVSDGNDLDELDAAITAAIAVEGQAALRLGQDDHRLRVARRRHPPCPLRRPRRRAAGRDQAQPLGFPDDKFFYVPDAAAERFREARRRGAGLQAEWEAAVDAHARCAELRRVYAGEIPALELDRRCLARRRPDRHPRGLRQGARTAGRPGAAARGRLGRPDPVEQHRHPRAGPTSRPATPRAATCASASASTAWARS